ncbi:MAG: sigma-70 family RNA polymerase sigma factor [Clostridia bacterium]|nr:sigma-70 family RNA polymerase sigma factor [Clostridia bacterium]
MDSINSKLVLQCKKNNEKAFHTLLSTYEKYIYTICYNYTNSREDALDLVQDICIKVLRGIQHFDESRPLLPWIKKITINTCINFKQKKRQTVSLDEIMTDDGRTLKDAIASQFNLEDFILFQDTNKTINETIHGIEEKYRMPLILRHKHEMSYEEMSAYLNLPLNTVKTNLYRGRKILKEQLTQKGIWGVTQ